MNSEDMSDNMKNLSNMLNSNNIPDNLKEMLNQVVSSKNFTNSENINNNNNNNNSDGSSNSINPEMISNMINMLNISNSSGNNSSNTNSSSNQNSNSGIDIEMLMNGPYPKFLKQRVVGSNGHLSNKDSSFYLSKLVGPNTKKILLMHLSETNNTEEKALNTIRETFKEYEIPFDDIKCAKQNELSEVINI